LRVNGLGVAFFLLAFLCAFLTALGPCFLTVVLFTTVFLIFLTGVRFTDFLLGGLLVEDLDSGTAKQRELLTGWKVDDIIINDRKGFV